MEEISTLGPSKGSPGAPHPSTVVDIPAQPPNDHFIWSIFCFSYSNICCLGLAALVFSVKARDRKMLGDMDGAQRHASTARCLNIASTVLVLLIILITVIVVTVTMLQNTLNDRQRSTDGFVRALMGAVCQSVIVDCGVHTLNTYELLQRGSLLKRYIKEDEKQLVALIPAAAGGPQRPT